MLQSGGEKSTNFLTRSIESSLEERSKLTMFEKGGGHFN